MVGARLRGKINIRKNKNNNENKYNASSFWVFLTILFLVLFLTTLYLYFNKNESVFSLLTGASSMKDRNIIEKTNEIIIDRNIASQKALDFFNTKILGNEAKTAVLAKIDEKDSLYEIKISYNNKIYEAYMTKDGRYFFPTGFLLEETQSESN
ncbi:MAG: hypothetical protein QXG00_00730 [Candidatus Woesearchaeota archaeon]